MAEDYDTTIKIGMKADTSGGVATEKQIDRLTQKAREFGKETNKSATSAIGAFERMGQSVNKVRGAIMGLGGVTAIVRNLPGVQELEGCGSRSPGKHRLNQGRRRERIP